MSLQPVKWNKLPMLICEGSVTKKQYSYKGQTLTLDINYSCCVCVCVCQNVLE